MRAIVKSYSATSRPIPRASLRAAAPKYPLLEQLRAARQTFDPPGFKDVHVACYGDAWNTETHVMLHGYPGSAVDWINMAPRLPKNAAVYVIEAPGFGLSACAEKNTYATPTAALALHAVLGELGLNDRERTVNFWNHSMGSEIFGEYLLGRVLGFLGEDLPRIDRANFLCPSMPIMKPLRLGRDIHLNPLAPLLTANDPLGILNFVQSKMVQLFGATPLGMAMYMRQILADVRAPHVQEWMKGTREMWMTGNGCFMNARMAALFLGTARFAMYMLKSGELWSPEACWSLDGEKRNICIKDGKSLRSRALKQIEGPVTVMIGQQDHLINPSYQVGLAHVLAELGCDVREVYHPHSGHMMPIEAGPWAVEQGLK